MTPPDTERTTEETVGCGCVGLLLMIIAAVLLYVLMSACDGGGDGRSDWCINMDQFYEDNPYDSNPQLERSYAMECS